MPFRFKIQSLFVLIVGVSCGLLVWLSLRKANRLAFELIQEKVYSIAVSAAPTVDSDLVIGLTDPEQDGSPDYITVRDDLRAVRDANDSGALPVRFIYIIRPLEDGEWEYVVDAEEDGDDKSYLGDEVEFAHEFEKPVLGVARADSDFAKDSFGTWLSAFAPIENSSGEPIAMVGVDIEAQRIEALLRKLLIAEVLAWTASVIVAIALGAWLSRKVTEPLTRLQEHVRRLSKGHFSERVEVTSDDEFAELARAINQMAEGLEERESLKGALVHYVRSQAADSKLTDAVQISTEERAVSVVMAELVGFDQFSDHLESDRVYTLLNAFFSTMIDIVLRHEGVLEQSSDNTVVALFGLGQESSQHERRAVEAALEMQGALERWQLDWDIRSESGLHLAVGIHRAIGAVRTEGSTRRLDGESARGIFEDVAAILEVA
ncbi:MAG: adenylate/guanylate cyclase domain-containing protein, partial [Verrucomicrobiota bacterium]